MTIIGCGGVFNAEDAFEQIKAGASLIQIDNATLTFEGPTCVSEIHKGLLKLLEENHFSNVMEAVGSGVQNKPETTSSLSTNGDISQNESVTTPVQPSVQDGAAISEKGNISQPAQQIHSNVMPPPEQPVQAPSFMGQNTQEMRPVPPIPPEQK